MRMQFQIAVATICKQATSSAYTRAYAACMEGRGYTVK